jgi:hypothetical protein
LYGDADNDLIDAGDGTVFNDQIFGGTGIDRAWGDQPERRVASDVEFWNGVPYP